MKPDFEKGNGLVPAIVQDANTNAILMLGYMNEESYNKTILDKKVCFFSRSKNRLWVKGETSGNFLILETMVLDCDNDSLLVKVFPTGPVCHKGTETCFGDLANPKGFLYKLEAKIAQRIDENITGSYSNELFKKGINKVAQKLGEEAVELVIESKDNDINLFKNEAADLLFHFMLLLKAKNTTLEQVEAVLKSREK
ncbi:MAG: bifunctional phosphoribosyl-AMP cyclohydrolase/phosphoribosyl-ATP diphosphatase HisIE [Ferruginibacter sp.]